MTGVFYCDNIIYECISFNGSNKVGDYSGRRSRQRELLGPRHGDTAPLHSEDATCLDAVGRIGHRWLSEHHITDRGGGTGGGSGTERVSSQFAALSSRWRWRWLCLLFVIRVVIDLCSKSDAVRCASLKLFCLQCSCLRVQRDRIEKVCMEEPILCSVAALKNKI